MKFEFVTSRKEDGRVTDAVSFLVDYYHINTKITMSKSAANCFLQYKLLISFNGPGFMTSFNSQLFLNTTNPQVLNSTLWMGPHPLRGFIYTGHHTEDNRGLHPTVRVYFIS
jgi:hypothetical protein